MKKLISVVLSILILTVLACPAALAADEIGVQVDGKAVQWSDAKPFIDANDRTLVPLRAVADAMGLKVSWNSVSRTAIFSETAKTEYGQNYEDTLRFVIGSSKAVAYAEIPEPDGSTFVMNREIPMDTAAVIVNDRTFAPVRYLAEYFGYVVKWDAASRMVRVDPTYISEPFYIADFEDGIAMRLYPGSGYEQVSSIKIVSGKINGTEATVSGDNQLPIHGSVYQISLFAAQPIQLETLESSFEITLKNGRVIERTYTQKVGVYPWEIVTISVA